MRLNLYEIYLGTLSITFPRVEPLETCKRASSRTTPFLPRFKVRTVTFILFIEFNPVSRKFCLNFEDYGRYGLRRRCGEFEEEKEGRGKHLSPPIWFGHLQDARRRVALGHGRSRSREDILPLERGRFLAKATPGPTSRLQLLHGNEAWLVYARTNHTNHAPYTSSVEPPRDRAFVHRQPLL